MIRVLTGVIGLVFVFSGLALYVLHFTRNPGNQMEASVPKARKTVVVMLPGFSWIR
jgi:protein-S-isoprenylcysteine O-methyltransferase Ste14